MKFSGFANTYMYFGNIVQECVGKQLLYLRPCVSAKGTLGFDLINENESRLDFTRVNEARKLSSHTSLLLQEHGRM